MLHSSHCSHLQRLVSTTIVSDLSPDRRGLDPELDLAWFCLVPTRQKEMSYSGPDLIYDSDMLTVTF